MKVGANHLDDANPPRRRLPSRTLTIAWGVSVACCIFAIGWLFLDPLAPRTVVTRLDLPETSPGLGLVAPNSRNLILGGLSTLALAGVASIFLGLFTGPPAHRGVRSWLAVTAIIAFWLGLAVSWQSLAAAGQQWRLGRQLDAFQSLAEHLQTEWPDSDDHIAGLGAFNAYPIGRPRTLLIIAAEQLAEASPVAAVERSDAGALRFELAGDETGAWLEWHPPGSQPASFTGGLEDERQLIDAAALNDGWYLTHYEAAPEADAAPSTPAK